MEAKHAKPGPPKKYGRTPRLCKDGVAWCCQGDRLR